MAENNVDALKLIQVLQEKLRVREDDNSMLQARLLMLMEEIKELTAKDTEPENDDEEVEVWKK